MTRVVRWNPDTDSEDELWVCPHCDAELHADCVGETCPVCGEPAEDTECEFAAVLETETKGAGDV